LLIDYIYSDHKIAYLTFDGNKFSRIRFILYRDRFEIEPIRDWLHSYFVQHDNVLGYSSTNRF
jgi:hypothetical protein